MVIKKKTTEVNLDFSFFEFLHAYYEENKGRIRQHYRDLTKKFLEYNDPSTGDGAFLRQPQYEALEMYVFIKEFLNNETMLQLVRDWHNKEGSFLETQNWVTKTDGTTGQMSFYDMSESDFEILEGQLEAVKTSYPNYIYALTMGLGKTILMATCIFYEFLLMNKFPKDKKYCHNAIVFAPDKTVLQSLREIMTFDKSKVVPREYASLLESNMKFHFLDDTNTMLSTIDGSDFNIVIVNNQKIITKRRRKKETATDSLFKPEPGPEDGFYSDIMTQIFGNNEDIFTPNDITINHRFSKLSRLPQLGVYVDEAHHLYGIELKNSLNTALRDTIDLLDGVLQDQGTQVVSCYNFTGTPYVQKVTLPDVVYSYGLKASIAKGYLKNAIRYGYENVQEKGFLQDAIQDFWEEYGENTYEGLLPKLAIFTKNQDDIDNTVLPEIEEILASMNIPLDKILVNTQKSSAEEVRDFNNLDVVGTTGANKQFIILIDKGREGWNCRSLFGVAMHRKPTSNVFVLQATMRCLRQITDTQQTARIYLSEENRKILNDELENNFRMSIEDLKEGSEQKTYYIRVNPPEHEIELKRLKRIYQFETVNEPSPLDFQLDELDYSKYKMTLYKQTSMDLNPTESLEELNADKYDSYRYSKLTLVGEIARYLNMDPIEVDTILLESKDGLERLLDTVNQYQGILYERIIPAVFRYKYHISSYITTEERTVSLLKIPVGEKDYYKFHGKPDMVIRDKDDSIQRFKDKSFHADTYVFDSIPERELFKQYLESDDVEEIYFTGMFTSKQGEFYIQYIDPVSHRVRNYFPDFVVKKKDGTHEIIEVKGDNKAEDEIVLAKASAAEEQVGESGYKYRMILGNDVLRRNYEI